MRRALICGVSGQDGALLANDLLSRGYDVIGTSRDADAGQFERLVQLGIYERVSCISLDLCEFSNVLDAIEVVRPDEVYNLAGPSSVSLSFEQPLNALGQISAATVHLFEAIMKVDKRTRLFTACSSECFGDTTNEAPANESTPLQPKSPYGIAKSAAHWLTKHYRDSYGLFACSGMLFNHESPLRGRHFVTKKIVSAVARIASGSEERLTLGRLDVVRDWGWAPDYVDAMWRMLQMDDPKDYVVATGTSVTLEEFVRQAFTAAGLLWTEHVDIDLSLMRPNEIVASFGDSTCARRELGWEPTVAMPELARRLVEEEVLHPTGAAPLYV